MRKIFFWFLKVLSKLVLKKYKPCIVGITGSVGKTTTKGIIYKVLGENFSVRASQDSFNNEIGLPLTILGLENSKSVLKWMSNFVKAKGLILFRDRKYPKVLVLEMGADRPGDINYLNSISPAEIAVLTEVSPVHVEGFGNIQKIYEEKTNIFRNEKNKISILNIDSEYISENFDELKKELKDKKILTYGFSEDSDVQAANIKQKDLNGLAFDLSFDGESVNIEMRYVIASHSIYSLLAAVCVGLSMGINLSEIKKNIEDVRLEKGRMSPIQGVKGSWIIDDSYNSSPLACKRALKTLSEIGGFERKIAVLGDMLELGELSQKEHEKMGKYIASLGNVSVLVTCGNEAKGISVAAIDEGFDEESSFHFSNSEVAKEFVKNTLKKGDLVLVKGSQGSRMEKIVKEIMEDKGKARDLLVRQSGIWEKK
jgi:UDP-N-acetylmuramoyl-tripeptide--D-alanyl-D-alanine ligase